MNVGFPFSIDGAGQVTSPHQSEHIRQLIEQLLFTEPGERVNRPDFGCGLMRAVFGAIGEEERLTLQFLIRHALDQWLSDYIETRDVSLEMQQTALVVRVMYEERETRRSHSVSFEVAVP